MTDFLKTFKQNEDISFMGMRDTAKLLLPTKKQERDELHDKLMRGTAVLDNEDCLNEYLFSYGNMHKAKLDEAFSRFPLLETILANDLEIYDWGCGQGTATICLLDYIKTKRISQKIREINLIDPSKAALERATGVIQCFNSDYTIKTIAKKFDDLSTDDFNKTDIGKLHLFSNILDVDAFDLAKFVVFFQHSFIGENHLICVSPCYSQSRRIDEFIAAIKPDKVYASFDKGMGSWANEWSISLRLLSKTFNEPESIETIKGRIDGSKKKDQFFAGYVLDAVAEEYSFGDMSKEDEKLYNSLSAFDVKSNISLDYNENCDPRLAVLANIISRGLPTKAPILVENIFSTIFGVSEKPPEGSVLNYVSTHSVSWNEIHEALHVVDPRFTFDSYNKKILDSKFEKEFLEKTLRGTDNECIIQLLEPQRFLSTIVDIPDRKFTCDQRVDFALEIPYEGSKTGFIVEIDGKPFHSNIFQRMKDKRRDKMAAVKEWETYRIDELGDKALPKNWVDEEDVSGKYISVIRRNWSKVLEGRWNKTLQTVLSPLAIARVERMVVQAMMSGALKPDADRWNIAVVERDVPCAAIAILDLREKYERLCSLSGTKEVMPKVNLSIVSTSEFKDSSLHMGKKVLTGIPSGHFNLCIDISMLLRDNVDALPLDVDADAIYIIRSAHYKKRERPIYTAENIQYPPLVKKDASGAFENIPGREEILVYFLREIFRKPSFLAGQLPILSRTLSDQTTIGLLPTGGGKSLTYQLSCMLQPGVAIVVDPLISLMMDQLRGLRDIRIDASDCLNSVMDSDEKVRKFNLLLNGSVMFMLVSPERFMMENFRENLVSMSEHNKIYFSYGIIDEVHCVSEWGHDFRTSYLHLGRNMINFMRTKSERPISIIGLTATASFDVLADVERELNLGGNLRTDSETIIRPENDSRPELTYRIIPVETNFDPIRDICEPFVLSIGSEWDLKSLVANAKKRKLCELINEEIARDIQQKNESESSCNIPDYSPEHFYEAENGKYRNAGIVFCPHVHGSFGVKDNEFGDKGGIASTLRADNPKLKVGTFVGGDSPTADMKLFNDNDLNIMVATKAFGMGIDKPNIRFTVNINHSSSIESYVQEAGRGGRDRRHAISYILYEQTEYIELSLDKINDIRALSGSENDPVWLEKYNCRFVLLDDMPKMCRANGCSKEQTDNILKIIRSQGFAENIDKGIDLWFHNNSFRGLLKEKVILSELTDRILNAKSNYLSEVQGKLQAKTGNEDVCLKVNMGKNSVTIFSRDDPSKQYGFIFLDTLSPVFKYLDFDLELCEYVSQNLIDILKTYDDHSAAALLRPLEGEDNLAEGIYSTLKGTGKNEYAYVSVSWENSIQQNWDQFVESVKVEISKIAESQQWNDIDERSHRKLDLRRVSDFDDLLSKIYMCSGDSRWLRNHGNQNLYSKLRLAFCKKRDKDDTDKAIYRMCCIGLVEDVTVDYTTQMYELKVRNHTDEELRGIMLDFFRKYYSTQQAEIRVGQIDSQKGRNYLDKCLGYLTKFVYESLEKKRFRAIEDISVACERSIEDRKVTDNDDWLKEFIHLYFNSKYARVGYTLNDKDYSLTDDTNSSGKDDFDVVRKYTEVVTKDDSGSEVDNVKHLYGATLLCLRAHPDNSALQLLLTFCLAFLGCGTNETLKNDAFKGYIDGFTAMYKRKDLTFWETVDEFAKCIAAKTTDDYIRENIVEKGKEYLTFLIWEEKFDNIVNEYTK